MSLVVFKNRISLPAAIIGDLLFVQGHIRYS